MLRSGCPGQGLHVLPKTDTLCFTFHTETLQLLWTHTSAEIHAHVMSLQSSARLGLQLSHNSARYMILLNVNEFFQCHFLSG